MPNVFRQIKPNDVHQRPFKAYKRYKIDNSLMSTGYVTHSATFYGGRLDHNGEIPYPLNSDGTNKHVAWYSLQQNYYAGDKGARQALPEHILNPLSSRTLHISASSLTIPYNDVGERIKNNTLSLTSSIGSLTVNLHDDGNGNLIDPLIDTSTFASASRNYFHMSFNDTFRAFTSYNTLNLGRYTTRPFTYKLRGQERNAIKNNNINIVQGIDVITTASYDDATPSGFAAQFPAGQGNSIRIPNDSAFNKFNKCDDWTISFWHRNDSDLAQTGGTIMTKFHTKKVQKLDVSDSAIKTRLIEDHDFSNDFGFTLLAPPTKARYPFYITYTAQPTNRQYFIFANDGTEQLLLNTGNLFNTTGESFTGEQLTSTGGAGTKIGETGKHVWNHVAIRNSGSILSVHVNGFGITTGSLPSDITTNDADIVFGARSSQDIAGHDHSLAEVRFYNHAVSVDGIKSLANNHYLSASCYQTNVAGNVFHRNGQIVTSSPLPKYNTGSGIFGNERTWNVGYRGTHTIYENQAFIRVPKDVLNVTVNPTSTYTPGADASKPCTPNQQGVLPGEVRKDLFVSGTLKPYITTIGLYNDQAELLAVGKLAQPIQKFDDIDMNFVVRWDY